MKYAFLSVALAAIISIPASACTSWMVFNDFTKNNAFIFYDCFALYIGSGCNDHINSSISKFL